MNFYFKIGIVQLWCFMFISIKVMAQSKPIPFGGKKPRKTYIPKQRTNKKMWHVRGSYDTVPSNKPVRVFSQEWKDVDKNGHMHPDYLNKAEKEKLGVADEKLRLNLYYYYTENRKLTYKEVDSIYNQGQRVDTATFNRVQAKYYDYDKKNK